MGLLLNLRCTITIVRLLCLSLLDFFFLLHVETGNNPVRQRAKHSRPYPPSIEWVLLDMFADVYVDGLTCGSWLRDHG